MTDVTIAQLEKVADGDVVVLGGDVAAAEQIAPHVMTALEHTGRSGCLVVVKPDSVTLDVLRDAAALTDRWMTEARLGQFVVTAPDDPDICQDVVVCSRCRASVTVDLGATLATYVAAAAGHRCVEPVDASPGA
jgi:hypothetical protein